MTLHNIYYATLRLIAQTRQHVAKCRKAHDYATSRNTVIATLCPLPSAMEVQS